MPNADHAPITHVTAIRYTDQTPDPNAAVMEVAIVGDDGSVVPPVTQGPAVADLTAAPTQTDFNNLLAALRQANVIKSS